MVVDKPERLRYIWSMIEYRNTKVTVLRGESEGNQPVVTKRFTQNQAARLINYTVGNNYWVEATGRATCRVCGEKIAKGERAIRTFTDFSGETEWFEPHGYATTRIYFHGSCVPSDVHGVVKA